MILPSLTDDIRAAVARAYENLGYPDMLFGVGALSPEVFHVYHMAWIWEDDRCKLPRSNV